ncbi:MAG: ABC transporter ATP-binding protein [Anaerolineales bacterium]
MTTVISVENLSKVYRLGQIGTGTISNDLKLWWAKTRGKPNPMLRIGETDHGNRDGQDLWALNDVSFTVKQGEVLGIIGKNGAGKSTLLKILSHITAPTSGRIRVKGRIASLLEVGTGFHRELTGRENIYLNGAILGMSRGEIDSKFDEIVDFSEIEKFIDTPVKRYSSGMYVRLAFAVAAHLEPEILVVDEVLAVGDAEFQKKCLGKMGSVAKEGRTILFVSHQMSAIQALCPISICLETGQLKYMGSTMETVSYYLGNKLLQQSENIIVRDNLSTNSLAYYTNVQLTSLENFPISTAISGQPLNIILSYRSSIGNLKLDFAIGIYDSQGVKLMHLSSTYAEKKFDFLPKEGSVVCVIPKLGLPEGNYILNLAMSYGKEQIDHVENAIVLNIHSGDYFGTGKLPSKKENKFFMENIWKMIP